MSEAGGGRRAALAALVCALAGFCWQAATVHFNFKGNWTALFCTGSAAQIPASLAGENIYVFPGSTGYDGQFYHYVAHDPLCRTDVCQTVTDGIIRYRRILLPATAYLLAFGQQRFIDAAYIFCNLAFLALGAWWLARWLEGRGLSAWYAALYVLVPASLIALDRLTLDMALTTFAIGFLYYGGVGLPEGRARWKLYAVLALAPLCRETGVAFVGACCVFCLLQRRWRDCAIYASAVAPFLAWGAYIGPRVPSPWLVVGTFRPAGLVGAALHPAAYPLSPLANLVAQNLDRLEALGILLAWMLVFLGFRKALESPAGCACLLLAGLGFVLPSGFWRDAYSGGRLMSPLLLFLFLEGKRVQQLPMMLVTPRIGLQLAPQVIGILRGIAGV